MKILFSTEPSKVESPSERKSIEQIQHIQAAQAAALEKKHLEKEKWYSVTVQVAVPFFIAGLGTIGAGIVLGNVTVSITFLIPTLFIIADDYFYFPRSDKFQKV